MFQARPGMAEEFYIAPNCLAKVRLIADKYPIWAVGPNPDVRKLSANINEFLIFPVGKN